MDNELMTFMGYEWVQVEGDTLTIGINEDGLEEFSEVLKLNLPQEGERVVGEEICGEIETDDGPLNLYSPVDGKVVEVNSALIENPDIIFEDTYGDGWLMRIEMDDPDSLNASLEDDDEDDDDDDDDDYEEEDEE